MEETRTILHAAIPALRSTSSKLERRSRRFPTPLVRNIFFATNAMDWLGVPLLDRVGNFLLREINKCVLRSQSLFMCEVITKVLQRLPERSPLNVSFHAEADARS